ncbi:Cupin 2 conserved barrel domain protein [Exiguobacterium sibiricum 255-15]|uniref:Cupin 2 conserved barrel domain protein n=1 Tax=Exiguobacterium sibiricum (strain DSM 17290 / CCUG 55495 / CIP 109462 / JCM 13490 / 255-15) TaxID=262543 RepID=B1YFS0_EXIS2|nr:cupin domain-containing protein [Exiguobacterium sibiricum]ACB62395.1 Cupin 2 conserved barrel domain protein [Exiguobacterium sibiricum 255-15]
MNVETFYFEDDGEIPNNPNLPVLIYRHAFDDPSSIEETFNMHNWKNSWVDGIFDFHHYHSVAHEVIGILEGHASIQLGGPLGKTFTLTAGDVVILPAGTGHKALHISRKFQVVSAYPNGQDYDTLIGDPCERPDNLKRIAQVERPQTDPVYGQQGPLLEHW